MLAPARLLALALGLAPAAASAAPVCEATTPLTLVGLDTAAGAALFWLPPTAGAATGWMLELPLGEGRARAAAERAGNPRSGLSIGPGPVLAGLGCGRNCLQPAVWSGGRWQPVGEPLPIAAGTTLHATYDRSRTPWLVQHEAAAGEGGVRATAYRLTGAEWLSQGSVRVSEFGYPAALPVPDRDDAVVSGTGLFAAGEPPGYWLHGLPERPPGRRGEITPLGGAAAAYVASDGAVYLTADRGRTWKRSLWHPWGTGVVQAARAGDDFWVESPVGGRTSPFLLAWFDRRVPGRPALHLSVRERDGAWRTLATLPGSEDDDPGAEFQHLLVDDAGAWTLVAGCAPRGAEVGLRVLRYAGGRQAVRTTLAIDVAR
jgi:hypothetical protein